MVRVRFGVKAPEMEHTVWSQFRMTILLNAVSLSSGFYDLVKPSIAPWKQSSAVMANAVVIALNELFCERTWLVTKSEVDYKTQLTASP